MNKGFGVHKRFVNKLLLPLILIVFVFAVLSNSRIYAVTTNVSCTLDLKVCDSLLETYAPNSTEFANTRVAGTLLGFSNFLTGAAETQPAPANLAYWWNDNVSRVPFAGKALAAPVTYSGPFLEIILGVWKLTRDVSYGLMAIVMLVIGFMIITRKKIGAQAAVTAQQALPRIVIALVLITFSYPIGALGASTAFTLRGNTTTIVQGIDWGSFSDGKSRQYSCNAEENLFGKIVAFVNMLDIRRTTMNFTGSLLYDAVPFMMYGLNSNEMASCGSKYLNEPINGSPSIGKLAAVYYLATGVLLGNGVMALLIAILILIAVFVFGILVYLKFFMLYLKLLLSIIGAPLQFAFGAIPGNEDVTTKWFKSFASLVISIPAMFFVFDLAWFLSFKAIAVALNPDTLFGGGTLMLMIVPFFYIFGANFARTLPEKIDAMIIGDPKKGGKR